MSRIFFDTNLFIYLLEDFGDRAVCVRRILERMSARRDELLTSTLTLAEILVKPLATGDIALVERYEKLLSGPGISVIPFDRACARIYAQLRKDKSLKAPDVVQLACAANARCDLFITNDDRLITKIVSGVQFIASLDRTII